MIACMTCSTASRTVRPGPQYFTRTSPAQVRMSAYTVGVPGRRPGEADADADASVLAEDELADMGILPGSDHMPRYRRGPLLVACLRLPPDHDNLAKLITTRRDRIVSGH